MQTDIYPAWLPKLQSWREEKRLSWQRCELRELMLRQLFREYGYPPFEQVDFNLTYSGTVYFYGYGETIHEWAARVAVVKAWLGREPDELKTDDGCGHIELKATWKFEQITFCVDARSPQCKVHPDKPGTKQLYVPAKPPELHPSCQQVIEELEG